MSQAHITRLPPAISRRLIVVAVLLLGACGGGRDGATNNGTTSTSAGQVAAPAAAAKVSFFAASRFAEQAAFGATPALIATLQAKGFEPWIDEQMALPASQIDPAPYLGFEDPTPDAQWQSWNRTIPSLAIGAADQLRLRVTWALSQYIVTSTRKVDLVGGLYWFNFLNGASLGNYRDLLVNASIHATMGQYLDNVQNRPKSAECPWCAPNENFARELMQLFSLGVTKLNADGTPQRDNRGRLLETYTQRDVEQMARVLTGWQVNQDPPTRPSRNYANWAKQLTASTWPPERDSGSKTVLGRVFPAGQSQAKDLQDAIDLLMTHPNIAPFVATRLIQHLVKSNPSPAYVGRVAARFVDNGSGVRGDLKAVVKAVLLDAEARAGDNPASARADDGKVREPFLHAMALWRGMGCSSIPTTNWNGVSITGIQTPLNAESVFSFYAPTDRAPGSNLLAPEQKLLTAGELRDRTALAGWPLSWNATTGRNEATHLSDAGCKADELSAAFFRSPAGFADLLSSRYFRGAMPPTLRSNLAQIMTMQGPPYNASDPYEGPFRMLNYALLTPYFGVIK